MDIDVIITGIIGIITTVVSGFTSWAFARKKYNVEVASNEIDNLKKSLDFYENIVNDNNEKLAFYIKVSEENRIELYRLKRVVYDLLDVSCLDTSCTHREFFDQDELKAILTTQYGDTELGAKKGKQQSDDYNDGVTE